MFFLKVILIIAIVVFVLYFLMIMPRMTGKPDKAPFVNKLYAHRGFFDNSSDAPENSMKAFVKAVEAGYGIELDVQLTSDNIPVVFHDFTLARVARYEDGKAPSDAVHNPDGSIGVKGKVCDYTYEELLQFHLMNSDEKIPLFSEFLKTVDGRAPLIVELKIEWTDLSVCPIADELLSRYKGRYIIESFNPLGLIWYRRHHKDVMRGQLSDEFRKEEPGLYRTPTYFVLANLLLNFLTKPDFIAYNHKYTNSLSRRLCCGFYGNVAAAWTIKSQKDLDMCRKHYDIYIFDSFIPDSSPLING